MLWPYVHLPIKGGTCHHNLSFVGRHRVIAVGMRKMGRAPWVYLGSSNGVYTLAGEGDFFSLVIPGSKVQSHAGTRFHTGEGLGESPELWGGWESWNPSLMLTSMAFFPG